MNRSEIGDSPNPTPEVYYDNELGRPDRPYSIRVNVGLYAQLLKKQGATNQQISETKVAVKAGLPNGELSEYGRNGVLLGKFVTNTRTVELYPDWAYTAFPNEPEMASYVASQTLVHETSHGFDSSKTHTTLQFLLGTAFDLKYAFMLYQAASIVGNQLATPSWAVIGATIIGTLATVDQLKPVRTRIIYDVHPFEIKARALEQLLETNPTYGKLVEIQPR